MKVLKFGSSSLSSKEGLKQAANIVSDALHLDKKVSLVVSATENATTLSKLLDIPSTLIDLSQLTTTDSEETELSQEQILANIKVAFSQVKTPAIIFTGFLASASRNQALNLGQGGPDYITSLIACALLAEEIQIWTTVDGVMTADPEKVKKAISIQAMSYQEAMELSHFGATVIHPSSLQPASLANIPVKIKNSLKPKDSGTLISASKLPSEAAITGISAIPDVSLLRVEGAGLVGVSGTAKRVFHTLSEADVNVILISQASSEHSICFALKTEESAKAIKALEQEFEKEIATRKINQISASEEMSIVAVVGENMRHSPGLAGKVFQSLGQNGINAYAIAQGSSELNLSVVVSARDETKALNALHGAFFSSELKTLNLFCVGTGQIGATLLEQLKDHCPILKKEQNLDIRVVGLANSTKMIFDIAGLNLSNWRGCLKNGSSQSSVGEYIEKMKQLNLPNSIFVDNTAHEVVADVYEDVLGASISVVTPNKKANSGKYKRFLQLQKIAGKANVNFFYETNVGAGLPIIETLKDLMRSGDEVLSIEAVLSGTLSYIFNSFNGEEPFSAVVKGAKENGYTEPDPRDDLSGMDVARKLLILGREMGLPLEEKDVSIESLIPECAANASSAEDFLEQLKNADQDYEDKRAAASSQNKKLVYIGKIEAGKAEVSLQAVGPEHAFSSLSGSDNIISFHTKRYNQCPLVVKGPGAGTEVTAAGVFADIIKAASYLL